MYRFALGYRHDNSDVEGFKGFGFNIASAEDDCLRQMRIKVSLIQGSGPNQAFDMKRVIRDESSLTPAEFEAIKQDWASNARYSPEGKIVRDAGPGTSGIPVKKPRNWRKRFRLKSGDGGPGEIHYGFCHKCNTPLSNHQHFQDTSNNDRKGEASPLGYCLGCARTLFNLTPKDFTAT